MSARDNANLVVKHCSFVCICLFVCMFFVDLLSVCSIWCWRIPSVVVFFLVSYFSVIVWYLYWIVKAIVCLKSRLDTEICAEISHRSSNVFRFDSELNRTPNILWVDRCLVLISIEHNSAQELSSGASKPLRRTAWCVLCTMHTKSAVTKNSGLVV